ncbi:cytochrome P450 [Dactylosporangium sp. NPDC051484]|uniref:cytochrome P450 n=1 Tax=Dactylosporangium sp. NPDC051484 TaxID=3154942 RepID=UPI003450905C
MVDRRRQYPPGPSKASAVSLLITMGRDRLGMMTSAAARYGDAARLPVGPKELYFFNHPDHAKHVLADNAANYHKGIGLVHARRALGDGLLTSEGASWRKQRKVVQPAFQSRRIAEQAGAVAAEAAKLVDRLRDLGRQGPVDVLHEMTGLTLGVLGRTLLDTDLSRFPTVGQDFAVVQDQAMFELASLNAVPPWVPLPRQLRFRRARRRLQNIVDLLVAERGDRTGERDDVLSRLIVSARGEDDPQVGRERLRDELVTLLLAGHETTASTLSWTLYLIDRHPEVRQRLRDEAVAVLGDRLPTFADLLNLRYTSMVIDEVVRLFPPVWILPRKALAADVVGGYEIDGGADVLICPYTLHRHRDFWDDPERFDPDRFDPARESGRPRYAYIPFGAGPRFCVGNHLGLMEAVFVISMLARELTLTKVAGYEVVPEPMLSLRIRGGLPMTVRSADAPPR